MEAKVSKAQISVWEWKEKAYEEVKHLPIIEQMQAIHEGTKQTVDQINKSKAVQKKAGSSPISF